ncbi:MAG: VWA domain-containing protein [Planctomycetota bacterium]|nr:VWA domain-containing protein [Planctomycetota bacterium]
MAHSYLHESDHGPAEQLLDLVLNSSAHLWHNRPGYDVNGVWYPAKGRNRKVYKKKKIVKPGLFVPAAVTLYKQLLDIYQFNSKLMAHFVSYALLETEWRDLKVACAALMLVQPLSGQPIFEDDGEVAFHDDDYREIGEAVILFYKKGSKKMLPPKSIIRIAELLEIPEIAALNREAGFASEDSKKPPLGRWKSAARQWLKRRELNFPLLQGLVRAGMKETIKKMARKSGYKPVSQAFFETLGWAQKKDPAGHREIGLEKLNLQKRDRFDELDEEQICERIIAENLSYKDVVGRLPAHLGLTPAILVTLLPSLSDRDLRILTPTLENFDLLEDEVIRGRWERAIESSSDQRSLNIAKNIRDKGLREKLQTAASHATRKAVEKASEHQSLGILFLIDKSGSMEPAIEASKDAITKILAGFPEANLHIAAFDTMGTVLKPKKASRAGVQHMLRGIRASGGTLHDSAVRALHASGVRFPESMSLIVIVAGDEAGETGSHLAKTFMRVDYKVSAMALINCAPEPKWRGSTIQDCAKYLKVPFSEVAVSQFDDPYQVPRVLRALLSAPVVQGIASSGWIEKVLSLPLLEKPKF